MELEYIDLNKVLSECINVNEDSIVNLKIYVENLTLIKLRDILLKIGQIHIEDIDRGIYVVTIKGGFAKKNSATLALQLDSGAILIAGYADEGLINQHTLEGVIHDFKKEIREYTV